MTERKFTSEEIIKALNACMTTSCRECPLNNDPCEIDYGGVPSFIVDLINRLKAENEKQDKEIKKLKKAKYVHCHVDYCADDLAKALKENKRLNEEVKNLTSANKNLTSDLTSSRAEIERLHNILLSFTNEVHNWSNKKGYDTTELSLIPILNEAGSVRETIKAEAIKDFADRLVHTLVINNLVNPEIFDYSYTLKTIGNLVKEMIEEKQ